MAERHHRFDGHEVEWTPGVGDGQGGPACCDSWGSKELDTTERLNGTGGMAKQNYAVRLALIPRLPLFPLYQNFIPEIPRFSVNMFSNSMTA